MVSKIHLLLLSTLGVLLCSLPAEAARLMGWRFNSAQNQLEFTTDVDVEPKAQLVFDPTRVVVDLPGIRLERPLVQENLRGTIRSYRIAQFDAQTTRIVIEVAPGYSLDPARIKVRGLSRTQWVIELPEPEQVSVETSQAASSSQSPSSVTTDQPQAEAPTQINEVRSTADGLFIRLGGAAPRVAVKRSRDRRHIDIEIRNSALGGAQIPVSPDLGKLGIQQISLEQTRVQPPEARIRLTVEKDAPDWKATVSNLGGIVLLPTSRPKPVANATGNQQTGNQQTGNQQTGNSGNPAASDANRVATVESISLDRTSNQLLLRVNQAARYSTRRDGGDLVLTLSPAQLAAGVQGPPIFVGDRLRRLSVQQRGPQSVEIRMTPDAEVTIGEVQAPSPQLLSLSLQRSRTASSVSGQTGPIRVTLPPGTPNLALPPSTAPSLDLPPLGNRRAVVVIDPGHGGPDPGAVGNGLRETEIVLDISRQVSGFLEAQGIQVVLTRNAEYELDLQPRVDIAERANATVFVSIHANAISLARPEVNGVETYYFSSGKALAETIHRSILESVDIDDRGVRQARFYVLRRSSMPAVLVETGFITGGKDKFKLADPRFRTQMAQAIARGILRYLQ